MAPPPTSWEVRVAWGDRRLHSEVLGPRTRTQLTLGNTRGDDVPTGHPSRVAFSWSAEGLEVQFTAGVTGTLQQRGDWPRSLGELVAKGVVREGAGGWTLRLTGRDALVLRVGTLEVTAGAAKLPARLPLDATALAILLLALLGVTLVVASVAAPAEAPSVQRLKR